jgi:hypothetical protein
MLCLQDSIRIATARTAVEGLLRNQAAVCHAALPRLQFAAMHAVSSSVHAAAVSGELQTICADAALCSPLPRSTSASAVVN